MAVADRVPLMVLLPPRLATAMTDAARVAGRLQEDGSIVLDHLILMAPQRAFEDHSKDLPEPSDGDHFGGSNGMVRENWAGTGPRRYRGGAESRPGRELRSPAPAPTREIAPCD